MEQYEQEYTLSDTMQRLMLTATDEQIQSYEPISYFDGLLSLMILIEFSMAMRRLYN